MTLDEAINHLQTHSTTNGSGMTTDKQHEEAKRIAIEALEQRMWIPVHERLPKIRQYVLCQCRGNFYSVLRLNHDSNWECVYPRTTYMQSFVIAWMPLPEPYKAESECKE